MALSAVRQRRSEASDPSPSQPYTKLDKPQQSEEKDGKGLGWLFPFLALGFLRYMSATSNIIHDCDEVFNYWEPLHYLLYKTGFQTWEYRYLNHPPSFWIQPNSGFLLFYIFIVGVISRKMGLGRREKVLILIIWLWV